MSTYTPIASQTAGGSVSSITFSSIPQGYTDLVLVFTGSVSSGSGDLGLRFNSDTGSNYSTTFLSSQAGGISGKSTSATSITATEYSYLDNVRSTLSTINFASYSNTTTYKSIMARSGKTGYGVESKVGLWRNTNAITSITAFTTGSNPNFTSGSTFSLYGIAGGGVTAKASGGIVTTDATYAYHTFTTSGAFTPYQALTVDYLVVAGGGGAGYRNANAGGTGGGGGGGMRCTVTASGGTPGTVESALSLSAKTYPVIVGAGGTPPTSEYFKGSNGSNSVFASITSVGGGGGGSTRANSSPGAIGGSGGGAGWDGTGTDVGGTGTANQGFAGGETNGALSAGAAGGGGASEAGGNAKISPDPYAGGAGGNGRATSITGSSVTYAGGGGGGFYLTGAPGTGGTGGGGNAGSAGTINTGGGGGGAGGGATATSGAAGGSGIVIIRYAL
jgi:hypothetical protein